MNGSGELFFFGSLVLLALAALLWSLWLLQRKQPPTPTFCSVEIPSGFNLHYQDIGSGPPILFLHGIGASLFCWRLLLPFLSSKYRLILLDLPGFGKSDKPTGADYGLEAQCQRLREFLDQLDLQRVFLVGSSMGGTLALWLSLREPERCKKLVTISPATDPSLVPRGIHRLARLSSPLSRTTRRWVIHQALRRVVLHHQKLSPEDVDQYWAPYKRNPAAVRTFLLATQAISDSRLPHELSLLSVPTLILWGEKDKMVPQKSMDQLKATLPKATLLCHSKAGHHVQEDQPEWTAYHIDQFFQSSV